VIELNKRKLDMNLVLKNPEKNMFAMWAIRQENFRDQQSKTTCMGKCMSGYLLPGSSYSQTCFSHHLY